MTRALSKISGLLLVGGVVLAQRTSLSGKQGFSGQCKLGIGSERYQAQTQAVKIAKPGESDRASD